MEEAVGPVLAAADAAKAGSTWPSMTITAYDWTADQLIEMSNEGLNQCLDKMAARLKQQTQLKVNTQEHHDI